MGVPHEIKPLGGLLIPGGGKLVLGVSLPSRVHIDKVVVARSDTVGAGAFAVDLFNNQLAAAGTNNTDEAANILPPELYRVMPTLTGANGKAVYFADAGTGGFGFPFFSQDPSPVDRLQVNQRVIWVVITATAGWTFSLVIGATTDMT